MAALLNGSDHFVISIRLRQTPIFDTNVFGDIQRGLISRSDWKCLLRHCPRRGWPLSSVTALELLAGIDAARPRDFIHVRERIALAHRLCNGRILDDPRFLICKELLRIPFPTDQLPPFSPTILRYMDVIRREVFRTTPSGRRPIQGTQGPTRYDCHPNGSYGRPQKGLGGGSGANGRRTVPGLARAVSRNG